MTTTDSPRVDQENKILLIGDLLIDKTIQVKVKKISPEAPVPVVDLLPDNRPIESPGGAGLAASYAIKDKIPLVFLTACPSKRANWLNELGIPTAFIRTTESITKIRYIDQDSNYHLLRVDTDQTVSPPNLRSAEDLETFKILFSTILEDHHISIVALLDYRKGLLNNPDLTQWIIKTCKELGLPTYTDSRAKDLRKFTGTSLLKLNSSELNSAFGALGVSSPREVMEKLNVETLLVTKGNGGAEVWKNGKLMRGTLHLVDHSGAPDVTGCGDVFDINFCYHWGIKKAHETEALAASVKRATEFAYEPIGERIQC